MSDQYNEISSPEDAVVSAKLGELYAAPSDPAYWSDLQVRILSRLADSDPGLWWIFLGRWSRAGIVAAALALMAAGVASVLRQDAESQLAYQSVFEDSPPLTSYDRVLSTAGISERDAAFRYVLSMPEGASR
jgi:hypothetical protein